MTTKPSTRGHTVALLTSMAFSAAIVIYLFAKLDWAEVWLQMRLVNLWYFIPLSIGFLALLIMRAYRWRLLLPNRRELSLSRIFDATVIGFFASTVLPLRAGEIIRPWVLSRWQPVSFSAALASILIERLCDAVCLLTLMAICLTRVAEIPPVVLAGTKALGILSGVLIIIVLFSYVFPTNMERAFHQFTSRTAGRFAPALAAKINGMITEYFVGVRVISSWWQLAQVVMWSFGIWLLVGGWFQVMLWAFGEHPGWWVGLTLNVVISLAVAAPSAPGFVGTFQVGCLIGLSTMFGYTREFAIAYSVIAHLLQTVLMMVAGLMVLHLRGLKFNQLREIKS